MKVILSFQETIAEISEKVNFVFSPSRDVERTQYTLKPYLGDTDLSLQKVTAETEIDIELLFNAVTKGNKI